MSKRNKQQPSAEPQGEAQASERANTRKAPKLRETDEERAARLAAKRTEPCLCGCGERVERFFRQGHDARVAGWLLAVKRGKRTEASLPPSVRHALESGVLRWPGEREVAKPSGVVLAYTDEPDTEQAE